MLAIRRSVRLKNYDYSQAGAYFVTICSAGKRPLFGRVENSKIVLSRRGRIVEQEWLRTVELREYLRLDSYVVMPNHFHAIVAIVENDAGAARCAPTGDIRG